MRKSHAFPTVFCRSCQNSAICIPFKAAKIKQNAGEKKRRKIGHSTNGASSNTTSVKMMFMSTVYSVYQNFLR